MRVLKFGGSSVADAGRMKSVTEIIAAAAAKERVAVVLSAMKGITDMLITAAHGAEEGAEGYRQVLETIRMRHFDA
ncbi:MAG: aspartate kinase, partial [Spirochaetia bacterium]